MENELFNRKIFVIIFDLDCMADDSHRRHLITHPDNTKYIFTDSIPHENGCILKGEYRYPDGSKWNADYPAYYNACDKDKKSRVMPLFDFIGMNGQAEQLQIWTGRCESVREKTENWFRNYSFSYATHQFKIQLKMRPISDDRPQEELFEEWVNDSCIETKWGHKDNINMVFSSHESTIAMFRARGVFVFDCNQGEKF